MQTTDAAPILKCQNVVASPRGLAEGDGRKAIVFVPAAEVNRVVLRFGNPEHSPIVSLAIGSILALLGLAGLVELFLATRGWRYETGMIFFGLIGGSLIFDATKSDIISKCIKPKAISALSFPGKPPDRKFRIFVKKSAAPTNTISVKRFDSVSSADPGRLLWLVESRRRLP